MPADDFAKLKQIVSDALERSPDQRAAFILQACGDDANLLIQAQSLLAAQEAASARGFLETTSGPPPLAPATRPPATHIPEAVPGTMIADRYKLIEPIGEGGMGLVWMAEQRTPVRRLVALKLIKAGMDSHAVLARFDAERQALAMMDHPSIARVFDGGTTDRRHPWFAMELVRGLPLTAYCDQRRMSVRDRLQLFMQICSAVQHAHQKGIIHRDLKPTNVLVTEHDGKPLPKVIDFGLAKALGGGATLTDQTLHTSFGAAAGTPLYMAPEQVAINALDVDTRADIYALGVILYELLTGTTPLERQRLATAAWDEVRRVIREEEAPRPSLRISTSALLPSLAATRAVEPAKLSGLIKGDLDWIVLKALEKDRNRRYETANGFAADIQRHLADEPVIACPPTWRYRAGKFAKKHSASLAFSLGIVVILAAGIIGTSIGFVRERSARLAALAAQREADQSRRVADERLTISENQSTQLRRQTYQIALRSSQQAFLAGELDAANEILRSAPEQLRGWEWKYLHAQCNAVLGEVPIPPHTKVLAHTHDGAFALLTPDDASIGPLAILDAATGAIPYRISLPPVEKILSAAMSSDCRRVAILAVNQSDPAKGLESSLYVWDKQAESIIWTQPSNSTVTQDLFGFCSPAINKTGTRVAVWAITNDRPQVLRQILDVKSPYDFHTSTGCYVFDIDGDHHRRTVHAPGGGYLTEDGRYLFADFPQARVVDVDKIAETESLNLDWNYGGSRLTGNPHTIAIQPKGPGYAWSSFDLAQRKTIATIDTFNNAGYLSFYAGGEKAIAVIGGFVVSWKAGPDAPLRIARAGARITELCINEKSRAIFAYAPAKISRFPLPTATQLDLLRSITSAVRAISPDARTLLIAEGDVSVLRDARTYQALGVIQSATSSSAFNNAGTVVASCNEGYLSFYRVPDGSLIASTPIRREKGEYYSTLQTGFDESGQLCWAASWMNRRGTQAFECIIVNSDSHAILQRISFKMDDNVRVIGCAHGLLWLRVNKHVEAIEAATGKRLAMSTELSAEVAAISWDRRTLAVVKDTLVTLFRLPELSTLRSWRIPQSAASTIAFGSDDRRLFVADNASTSINDVDQAEVLVSLPNDGDSSLQISRTGDAAVFGTHLASLDTLKERWTAIEAADDEARVVRDAAASHLDQLLTSGTSIEELPRSIAADRSLSTMLRIAVLQQLKSIQSDAKVTFAQLEAKHIIKERFESAIAQLKVSPATRKVLEQLCAEWKPDRNSAYWSIVHGIVPNDRQVDEYAGTLVLSRELFESETDLSVFSLNVLAGSLYRTGDYQQAAAIFLRADQLWRDAGSPAWWTDRLMNRAFLAMCYARMGERDKARSFLGDLRDTPPADPSVETLRAEATALIDPATTTPSGQPATNRSGS